MKPMDCCISRIHEITNPAKIQEEKKLFQTVYLVCLRLSNDAREDPIEPAYKAKSMFYQCQGLLLLKEA